MMTKYNNVASYLRASVAVSSLFIGTGMFAGETHLGQSTFTNTSGRELMINNDDGDSTVTFHDAHHAWYSMGIDVSDNRTFKINYGGEIGYKNHFNMDTSGRVGIGRIPDSNRRLSVYYDSGGTYSSSAVFTTPHSHYNLGDTEFRFVSSITSGASHLYLEDKDNSDSRFLIEALGGSGGVDAFFVTSSGKVGIGTDSPDNKLDVNGTIRAEEIIVETSGADFVFEEEYELPSLAEVESHIEENGHLPGVPSASTMQVEGLSLGDSQTLLLQKIEELTLYSINQQKQIDSLILLVETQQKELAALKTD